MYELFSAREKRVLWLSAAPRPRVNSATLNSPRLLENFVYSALRLLVELTLPRLSPRETRHSILFETGASVVCWIFVAVHVGRRDSRDFWRSWRSVLTLKLVKG